MRFRKPKYVKPDPATTITPQECLMSARIAAGMNRQEVADAIGRDVKYVLAFERAEFDPHLSELRTYAFVVNALSTFKVTQVGKLADDE